MILYDGGEMHEGLRRWLAGIHRPFVPEMERCVNEGAEGCTGRAGDSGWCQACWSTIVCE